MKHFRNVKYYIHNRIIINLSPFGQTSIYFKTWLQVSKRFRKMTHYSLTLDEKIHSAFMNNLSHITCTENKIYHNLMKPPNFIEWLLTKPLTRGSHQCAMDLDGTLEIVFWCWKIWPILLIFCWCSVKTHFDLSGYNFINMLKLKYRT